MAIAERELTHDRELNQAPLMEGWSKEQRLLHNLVRHEGSKVGDVARAVGVSHSAISQYISGKYASVEALDPRIKDYLMSIGRWEDDHIQEIRDPVLFVTSIAEIGMVQTLDLQRVHGVCTLCYQNREMGMIVGKPGTGKTFAFREFGHQSTVPHTIITCDETTSVKSVLVDVSEALNLPPRGASSTLMRRIVKYLRNHPILLIFDEADLLRGPKVFETIRALYDKSGTCGVVLCGNNNLAERILVFAEDRPELARLRDRIGYFKELTGVSPDEAAAFLTGINCTPEAKGLLESIARRRGIRQLMKALARLLDATQGGRITADLVEELGEIVLSFNA